MSLAQRPGLIYGQVVGATGAFTAAGAAPAPAQNPVCNLQGITITPARTGAGVYTLTSTFTQGGAAAPLPATEYKWSVGIAPTNVAVAGDTAVVSVAANVATVRTAVAAGPGTATDKDFWFEIEPITG